MKQWSYLEEKIDADIVKVRKRSDSNRDRSAMMGVSTIIFGACVTVFLGWRREQGEVLFKNLALIWGVWVTVIGSIERFFNYRTVWLEQTVTVLKLHAWKNEIEFYRLDREENTPIDEKKVHGCFRQYQEIWDTVSEEWSQRRSQKKPEEQENKEGKYRVDRVNGMSWRQMA